MFSTWVCLSSFVLSLFHCCYLIIVHRTLKEKQSKRWINACDSVSMNIVASIPFIAKQLKPESLAQLNGIKLKSNTLLWWSSCRSSPPFSIFSAIFFPMHTISFYFSSNFACRIRICTRLPDCRDTCMRYVVYIS